MDIKQYMQGLGEQARQASRAMSAADSDAKNGALLAIAQRVQADRERLWQPMRIWRQLTLMV